jgi:hypothetical protein
MSAVKRAARPEQAFSAGFLRRRFPPRPCEKYIPMLGLTDNQLKTIMTAAASVQPDRRSVFLERTAAMLRMRGYGHFTDADVADVAKLALTGLAHQPAA